MAQKEMSFLDHIDELRSRLVKIVIGMIIPVAVSMTFYEELFAFMLYPINDMGILDELLNFIGASGILENSKTPAVLQAINPTDTFLAALKISVTVGIFVSLPWIMYQIWSFVVPALTSSEKTYTTPVVLFASTFFLIGSSFAYFIVLPFALNFLANFGGDMVKNQWAISEYFDLILKFLLSFGIVFEMPLLAFILAKLDLLTASFLRTYRRYAVVIIIVLAAILTPPDVVSQVLMAIPLLLLYELSIWIVKVSRPKSPFEDE
jgi:sec-independent protein translocase protein TatC